MLRRKTKVPQKLPKELEGKVTGFLRSVIKHHKVNGYKLSCIGNMDETPSNVNMVHDRNVFSLQYNSNMVIMQAV